MCAGRDGRTWKEVEETSWECSMVLGLALRFACKPCTHHTRACRVGGASSKLKACCKKRMRQGPLQHVRTRVGRCPLVWQPPTCRRARQCSESLGHQAGRRRRTDRASTRDRTFCRPEVWLGFQGSFQSQPAACNELYSGLLLKLLILGPCHEGSRTFFIYPPVPCPADGRLFLDKVPHTTLFN